MISVARAGPRRLAALWQTTWRALPWLLLAFGAMAYVGARYRIAIDDQVHKCLPPYTVFLIDRHDRALTRGAVVSFAAGWRMAPFFRPDLLVTKRIVGLPGDRVEVTARATRVNGQQVGEGLDLAATLQRPAADFERTLTVPEGFVWVMGDTRDSFDARYWGARPMSDVIGRARPIW